MVLVGSSIYYGFLHLRAYIFYAIIVAPFCFSLFLFSYPKLQGSFYSFFFYCTFYSFLKTSGHVSAIFKKIKTNSFNNQQLWGRKSNSTILTKFKNKQIFFYFFIFCMEAFLVMNYLDVPFTMSLGLIIFKKKLSSTFTG